MSIPYPTLLLCLLSTFASAAVHANSAAIRAVVVYRDRAQVTRVTLADCAKGTAEFAGLPSTLDVNTLRAAIRSGELLGVTWKKEFTGPREKAQAINAKLAENNKKLTALSREMEVARIGENKLEQFRQHLKRVWGDQARGARPPVALWDQSISTLREEALTLTKKRREAEITQRKLHRERRELYRQRQQLYRQERRTTYRATALVRCSGQPETTLAYVLPGATWRISYQARADLKHQRLTLIAQATVAQATGEDWSNVKLAVSTANLRRKNDPPSIRRMNVTTYEPASTTKILARRFEARRHLTVSVASGAKKDSEAPGPSRAPSPLVMQLVAQDRLTVLGDGREVSVTLMAKTQRASYAFESAPKLFPFIYHRVELENPFPFPMLAGPVSIYRGNTFIGRTRTKERAPHEPVKLSLGVDNQLQIRRWVKKEVLKKPTTFSPKQQLVHRYLIEVGNWTARRRKVVVVENVPVPQVKELALRFDKKSTPPSHYDAKDGLVRWELELAPRSKKELWLSYTVDVPKEYVVRGYIRE